MKKTYDWSHQMINKLIAAFGVVLIIGGFYAMTFGFSTPPSILLFFIGLILTVFGVIAVIIFGSKVDMGEFKRKPKEKVSKAKNTSQSAKSIDKSKSIIKKANIPKSPHKIQPKASKNPQDSNIKSLVTDKKDISDKKSKKKVIPKKIEPKRIKRENIKETTLNGKKIEKPKNEKNKGEVIPKKVNPISRETPVLADKSGKR